MRKTLKEYWTPLHLEDKSRVKAKNTQSAADWLTYKKLRNKCNYLAKRDKTAHFEENENGNISKLYSSVKTQLGWNSGGPPQSLVVNGQDTSSSISMDESQMEYFHCKVNKLLENIPVSLEETTAKLEEALHNWGTAADNRKLFEFTNVTLAEKVDLIKSLGNGKAFGHDTIDSWSLKLVAPAIYKPI